MFLVFFLASDGGREKLEWLHVASVKFRGRRLVSENKSFLVFFAAPLIHFWLKELDNVCMCIVCCMERE